MKGFSTGNLRLAQCWKAAGVKGREATPKELVSKSSPRGHWGAPLSYLSLQPRCGCLSEAHLEAAYSPTSVHTSGCSGSGEQWLSFSSTDPISLSASLASSNPGPSQEMAVPLPLLCTGKGHRDAELVPDNQHEKYVTV